MDAAQSLDSFKRLRSWERAREAIIAGVLGLTFLLALFVLPRMSFAGGQVGDGTPSSCTEAALDSALSGGGTVTFNCGGPQTIALTTPKTIVQATTIDGGGLVVLRGTQNNRAFVVNSSAALTLENIILSNFGVSNTVGGTVYSAGPLVLDHVTVRNGIAPGANGGGGALYAFSRTAIASSSFENNNAGTAGAILAASPARIDISRTTFDTNKTTDPNGVGGAIQLKAGVELTMTDGLFIGNVARFGGAINLEAGSSALLQSASPTGTIAFHLNQATENGGAIWNAGLLNLKNGEFNANSAPTNTLLAGYGGALSNIGGVLSYDGGSMTGNQGRFGGALFSGNGAARAVINNVDFFSNSSSVYGGALYANTDTSLVTITHSIFRQNDAQSGGGAIARLNAALWLVNSSLISNSASSSGGGLLVLSLPTTVTNRVSLSSVTISGNKSPSGTGGGIESSDNVDVYYTTVKNNTPIGVHSTDGNVRFRSTVLETPGGQNCSDPNNTISDDHGNFATDSTCALQPAEVGADAKLGPLTGSVAQTFFHAPLANSPLVNAGFSICPMYDQRGASRIGACDVGAVELGATPVITSLNPVSATAGSPALFLVVAGDNFIPDATVEWNGAARSTTFASRTQVIASIPAADLTTAATVQVRVRNPGPNDGVSGNLPLTVVPIPLPDPVPTPPPLITALIPSSAVAGSPDISVTVAGDNFQSGATVEWNGVARVTSFISRTRLIANIPATDLIAPTSATVTVRNPDPNNGLSNALPFTITIRTERAFLPTSQVNRETNF